MSGKRIHMHQIRMTEEEVGHIEEFLAHMRQEMPNVSFSFPDAMRQLAGNGYRVWKAERPVVKKRKVT